MEEDKKTTKRGKVKASAPLQAAPSQGASAPPAPSQAAHTATKKHKAPKKETAKPALSEKKAGKVKKAEVKPGKKVNKDKEVRAVARFVQMPPRKLRYVIDTIRGRKVSDAMTMLKFTPAAAASKLYKVLKSAVSNAENNFNMDTERLYIAKAYVDPGPTQKRYLPRAMGRASLIFKRSSHITITVKEMGG